jgi:hypothetical protein
MNERSFIVKWPFVLRGKSQLSRTLGRGSNPVQWQGVGLLRKLPNRSHCAHGEKGVERDFQNVSAFFFRLNKKPVSRFLFHNFLSSEDAAERRFCLSSLRVIIGLRTLDAKSP